MKTTNKKLFSLLLCAVMLLGAVIPVFAANAPAPGAVWEASIVSVTPVGDQPSVKIGLTPEGYQIRECRLPRQYDVLFKDGTSVSVQIPAEPSHFAPLVVYENFFDVETPQGPITLYARVMLPAGSPKEPLFSVGQYYLAGTLGEDGTPVAGSSVYELPIFEEPCAAEIDEGGFFVRVLHFFYSLFQKIWGGLQRFFHDLLLKIKGV